LKAQTDINGFLEGYLRHVSASKPTSRTGAVGCCLVLLLINNQKAMRQTSAPSSGQRLIHNLGFFP